jgi:hypothetical protein
MRWLGKPENQDNFRHQWLVARVRAWRSRTRLLAQDATPRDCVTRRLNGTTTH